jgi:hypothetical protein
VDVPGGDIVSKVGEAGGAGDQQGAGVVGQQPFVLLEERCPECLDWRRIGR